MILLRKNIMKIMILMGYSIGTYSVEMYLVRRYSVKDVESQAIQLWCSIGEY